MCMTGFTFLFLIFKCAIYIVVKIFLEIKLFSKWLVFTELLKLILVMFFNFQRQVIDDIEVQGTC